MVKPDPPTVFGRLLADGALASSAMLRPVILEKTWILCCPCADSEIGGRCPGLADAFSASPAPVSKSLSPKQPGGLWSACLLTHDVCDKHTDLRIFMHGMCDTSHAGKSLAYTNADKILICNIDVIKL